MSKTYSNRHVAMLNISHIRFHIFTGFQEVLCCMMVILYLFFLMRAPQGLSYN